MRNTRRLPVTGIAFGLTILASLAIVAAADYPGGAPGSAQAGIDGDSISLGNKALSVHWIARENGLLRAGLRDEQTGDVLPSSGPTFRIVMSDGTEYAADAMNRATKPVIADVPPLAKAVRAADRMHGRQVSLPLVSADDKLGVTWRAVLRDGSNYVREELELVPKHEDVSIREVILFDEVMPGAKTAGTVDGSPVVAGNFFLGFEDPMSVNNVTDSHVADNPVADSGRVTCQLKRDATLGKEQKLTLSFVAGVAPAGQMRRAFLYYVECERAHPYRPFLHYNCWYDIAWHHYFSEEQCLDAVKGFGEQLIRPYGVTMDSMVFDDGWDDYHTLWQFHEKLPNGFSKVDESCRSYGTRVGVWLSPFGGYGAAKGARLKYGRSQGYETNAAGFSLSGPKYYARFKSECRNMIRKYGVNYFKFDGIVAPARDDAKFEGIAAAAGARPTYILDTEALRRLMLELRDRNNGGEPDLFINFTSGSWPSPFWLRYADSLWRQGHDTGFRGPGPAQQQCLTYRDGETYRNIVRRGTLYPINSLMTGGIIYSRNGNPGRADFTSAGLKDDIHAYFASGTCLQELYLQPSRLTPADWKVLAESAQWARANADILLDTHWIGGDPNKLEVYGWASWTPRKGIVSLRNPNDRPQTFSLDVQQALELPNKATKKFVLRSPWKEDAGRAPLSVEAGKPATISLRPFEIVTLECTEPGAGSTE